MSNQEDESDGFKKRKMKCLDGVRQVSEAFKGIVIPLSCLEVMRGYSGDEKVGMMIPERCM